MTKSFRLKKENTHEYCNDSYKLESNIIVPFIRPIKLERQITRKQYTFSISCPFPPFFHIISSGHDAWMNDWSELSQGDPGIKLWITSSFLTALLEFQARRFCLINSDVQVPPPFATWGDLPD